MDPAKRVAYIYEKASWRQMLIQQPPVRALAHLKVRCKRSIKGYALYKHHARKYESFL
ncbi:hypothetical protein BDV29DRAFT_185361 [Aspergillus leporis]|uniref:Uncharacterized protein n=1 Tax=Aspergillus leporis TaxID=41062 RepID=A0A5N5WHL5_9EURO|nr:hypothetical protein BDV29DRAFT_185361 [Aspergillus leporis]